MALFVSTYVNKVDRKGRVSIPAQFRTALGQHAAQGVFLFRSSLHPCLEGVSWAYMEEVGRRLDGLDMFSGEQDDLATAIFGDSVQVQPDAEGRIILPAELAEYADITERGVFVGLGRKFQIWEPGAFEKRRGEARKNIKAQGISLPGTGGEGRGKP